MEPTTERPEMKVTVALVEDEGRTTDNQFSFSRFGPEFPTVSVEQLVLSEIRQWAEIGFKTFRAAEGFKIPRVIPWHSVREIELEYRGPKA